MSIITVPSCCSRTKSIQFVLITNVHVTVCLHGILILCLLGLDLRIKYFVEDVFFIQEEKLKMKVLSHFMLTYSKRRHSTIRDLKTSLVLISLEMNSHFFVRLIYLLKHTFPTKVQQYLHVSFVYI